MNWQIDRRTFLRSSAGAALPLPFLNLMERQASGAVAEQPPVRFMTLFKPNGVHPPSWNINGGQEFDFRMSPLMQPFAKHKDDLLILDNMGDFGFSSHASSTRRFLSGHHENKTSASIDQLIADQISDGTSHRSLELTTEGLFPNQIGCSYISYDQNGDAIPRESDPQLVFDRLFRNPMSHPDKRKEMTSLLDRVSDDARSLARRAGKEDRQTLEQYLTVVRETEKRLQTMKSNAQPKTELNGLQRPSIPGNLDEQVESMLDLISLALWTDSTRCITYMLGNSNSRMIFDFLGVKEQHHYLSHFFRNFSRENIDGLMKISLWHMAKFDSLLNRLKSYKDHHGTLLDHSVVLFGSGMGHSDNHTVTRIPLILAGRGGGMIKTGRYVRYSENQQLGRLHLALLQKFGVEVDSFAGSTHPLPGLDASDYTPFRERPFDSWVRHEEGTITVQGRLRLSEDLNEARIFFVDVEGASPVKVDVEFRDFHQFNLPYHCGTPINLTGTGTEIQGQLSITKVTQLKSLFGKDPGTLNG
ncbi:DUF1552 domain-containing protein [Thalassoglobus sp. JC818]|uniref:DUF1552 domain-containing protein n=1 Tax=Thalassoglobus sp. JC818 TaxID=3232136 RepID=UPI003457A9FA